MRTSAQAPDHVEHEEAQPARPATPPSRTQRPGDLADVERGGRSAIGALSCPPCRVSLALAKLRYARARARSSAAGCCAGFAATGATCPGAAPAIPIGWSSPSSCCSRPRWPGSRPTTTGSSARYPDRPAPGRARTRPLVRESWEGLGYYRRAANLHRLAQAVVAERGGRHPRRSGRAAAAARRGTLHRRRGGQLRLRAPDGGGGHQRRARHPPRLPPARSARRGRAPPLGRPAPRIVPRAARSGVGVQSGDHGAGRAGVHGAGGAMRRVSGAAACATGRRADGGLAAVRVTMSRRRHSATSASTPRDRADHLLPLRAARRSRRAAARPDRAGRASAPWAAPMRARAARRPARALHDHQPEVEPGNSPVRPSHRNVSISPESTVTARRAR